MTVKVYARVLGYRAPFGERGTGRQRPSWVVRISDGRNEGWGEASPLPGWPGQDATTCARALRSWASGGGTCDTETFDALPSPARHAVHGAWADLEAQRAGLPLSYHLADKQTEFRISSHVLASGPDVVANVAALAEEGVASVKVKLPRSVPAAVELAVAIRAAAPGVTLRGDANGHWPAPDAPTALEALRESGWEWIEQPIAPGTPDLLAIMEQRTGMAVAADEDLHHAKNTAMFVENFQGSVVVLKPMVLGGVDRAMNVARRAEQRGTKVVITSSMEGAIGRATAVHAVAALQRGVPSTRAWLFSGLATGRHMAWDLGPDPIKERLGTLSFADRPGIGFGGLADDSHGRNAPP